MAEPNRRYLIKARRAIHHPGRNLDDIAYLKIGLLGSGGQGGVWLVDSSSNEQLRARKVLKPPAFRKYEV